jgi:integrase
MRDGEALGLTWDCGDLEHGMIRLDENKTIRARGRFPRTSLALRIYRKMADSGTATGPVFIQRSKWGLAETFRLHLERAGVKRERPELFATTATRQQIRVHDCAGRS